AIACKYWPTMPSRHARSHAAVSARTAARGSVRVAVFARADGTQIPASASALVSISADRVDSLEAFVNVISTIKCAAALPVGFASAAGVFVT
ncbi:MAG: hypothetical protein ACRD3S_08660, partial [Terracidiphilus sp.]